MQYLQLDINLIYLIWPSWIMIIMIIINTIKKILFFIISFAASTVLLDREKLQEPSLSVSQLYQNNLTPPKSCFFPHFSPNYHQWQYCLFITTILWRNTMHHQIFKIPKNLIHLKYGDFFFFIIFIVFIITDDDDDDEGECGFSTISERGLNIHRG